MPNFNNSVTITEVAPRDGLQFEAAMLSTQEKIHFINSLSECGISHIECGSFVDEKKIPQMKDSGDVLKGIERLNSVRYSALVPNVRGMQGATDAQCKNVAVITATSDQFCEKNIGCSGEESLQRITEVITIAKSQRCSVRAYISCIFACPYEGRISTKKVVKLAAKLMELGCDEISLGDTIGVGTASQTQTLLLHVASTVPINKISVHFHDTRGQALANILAAMEMGVSRVDSSVAGLGGCPYAPGASGNVSSEDVVYMLNGLGVKTGINLQKLIQVGRNICDLLQRPNHSRVGCAGLPEWMSSA